MTMEVITEEAALIPYKELEGQLISLQELNDSLVFDLEDETSVKSLKSHVRKLRSTKKAIDRVRKEAKAPLDVAVKAVQSTAKGMTEQIDKMIAKHEEPLKALQEAEDRLKNLVANLEKEIIDAEIFVGRKDEYENIIAKLESTEIPDEAADKKEYLEFRKGKAIDTVKYKIDQIDIMDRQAKELAELKARIAAAEGQGDKKEETPMNDASPNPLQGRLPEDGEEVNEPAECSAPAREVARPPQSNPLDGISIGQAIGYYTPEAIIEDMVKVLGFETVREMVHDHVPL